MRARTTARTSTIALETLFALGALVGSGCKGKAAEPPPGPTGRSQTSGSAVVIGADAPMAPAAACASTAEALTKQPAPPDVFTAAGDTIAWPPVAAECTTTDSRLADVGVVIVTCAHDVVLFRKLETGCVAPLGAVPAGSVAPVSAERIDGVPAQLFTYKDAKATGAPTGIATYSATAHAYSHDPAQTYAYDTTGAEASEIAMSTKYETIAKYCATVANPVGCAAATTAQASPVAAVVTSEKQTVALVAEVGSTGAIDYSVAVDAQPGVYVIPHLVHLDAAPLQVLDFSTADSKNSTLTSLVWRDAKRAGQVYCNFRGDTVNCFVTR